MERGWLGEMVGALKKITPLFQNMTFASTSMVIQLYSMHARVFFRSFPSLQREKKKTQNRIDMYSLTVVEQNYVYSTRIIIVFHNNLNLFS